MVQGELVRGFLSAGTGAQPDYATVRRVVQLVGSSSDDTPPHAEQYPNGVLIHKRVTVANAWEVRVCNSFLLARRRDGRCAAMF